MATKKELANATKLVDKLIADELLELADTGDTSELATAVAAQLVLWTDDRYHGHELGELLASHPRVAEVFATDDDLQVAITRWRTALRPAPLFVTDARNPDIEAKLLAEPDDELATVYADWLIDHGNPLGELFACAANDAARKRVLTKHGPTLWGAVTEYRALFDVEWTVAGATSIIVTRATAMELEWGRVIAALLDRPLAMFCHSLHVGPLPAIAYTQFDDMFAIIGARPRPALRTITIEAGERAVVGLPDLGPAFPALRELRIAGRRVDAPMLAHPLLHHLALAVESPTMLPAVFAHVDLPSLHTLELRFPWLSTWSPHLAALALPNLRRFALTAPNAPAIEPVLAGLVEVPWLAHLEELDLSGLRLDRSHVSRYRERLAHLRLVL